MAVYLWTSPVIQAFLIIGCDCACYYIFPNSEDNVMFHELYPHEFNPCQKYIEGVLLSLSNCSSVLLKSSLCCLLKSRWYLPSLVTPSSEAQCYFTVPIPKPVSCRFEIAALHETQLLNPRKGSSTLYCPKIDRCCMAQ